VGRGLAGREKSRSAWTKEGYGWRGIN
jgi:hypothetical protein